MSSRSSRHLPSWLKITAAAVAAGAVLAVALAYPNRWNARTAGAAAGAPALTLSLDEAKRLAAEKNPARQVAELALKRARVDYEAALRLPQISKQFESSYSVQAVTVKKEQAEGALKLAEVSRDLSIQGIQSGVEQAYLGVLRAEEGLRVARASAERAAAQRKAVAAAVDAGTSARIDLLQAEAAASVAQADVSAAERAVQSARLALNNAIGVAFDAQVTLTTRLERPKQEPNGPTSPSFDLGPAIRTAKAARLEAGRARLQLKLAQTGMDLVKLSLTPNVDTYRYAEIDLPDAELKLTQALNAVELDVRQAHLKLLSAAEWIQAVDASAAAAREARRIAEARREAGLATLADVLAAEAGLAAAEAQQVNALADYNVALLAFNNALGPSGGKPPQAPPAPSEPANAP